MLTVSYEPVRCSCRCPKCEREHQRTIFPELYAKHKERRFDGLFIVFCIDCEAELIREWNRRVKLEKVARRNSLKVLKMELGRRKGKRQKVNSEGGLSR